MPHFIILEAHVNPPPNPTNATISPVLIPPDFTASSRASGTEADEVFPYLSTFTITFFNMQMINLALNDSTEYRFNTFHYSESTSTYCNRDNKYDKYFNSFLQQNEIFVIVNSSQNIFHYSVFFLKVRLDHPALIFLNSAVRIGSTSMTSPTIP